MTSEHFDAQVAEPKVGVNWGMSRRHILTEKPVLMWPTTYQDAYRTLCGGDIMAYDPADESIPHHIKGRTIGIGKIPWCKNCKKRGAL